MNAPIYCVILAGGSGERLWPLSRHNLPKQLIPFHDQSTLLEHAIKRAQAITTSERIWLITTEHQAPIIDEKLGSMVGRILTEPVSRNTAPAVLMSCLEIAQRDPDAFIVFLPADHIISPLSMFVDALHNVFSHAQQNDDYITILGVKPSHPATGYGYIEHEDTPSAPYQVTHFHEKPDLATAQEYVKKTNILWNIGIFCAHVQTFINQFRTYASAVFNGMQEYRTKKIGYHEFRSESFDCAVLEKSLKIRVHKAYFSWLDVGNLTTFLTLTNQTEQNNVMSVQAHNNLISSSKLVALIGVDNLCIVETDNVLLIVHQQETEKIRSIVHELKQKSTTEYL